MQYPRISITHPSWYISQFKPAKTPKRKLHQVFGGAPEPRPLGLSPDAWQPGAPVGWDSSVWRKISIPGIESIKHSSGNRSIFVNVRVSEFRACQLIGVSHRQAFALCSVFFEVWDLEQELLLVMRLMWFRSWAVPSQRHWSSGQHCIAGVHERRWGYGWVVDGPRILFWER